MAKKFFFICAGLLMLALAYHFGATTATAQAPGNPIVGTFDFLPGAVVLANGDVYLSASGSPLQGWHWYSNVFAGSGPVPTPNSTWGQLKARYR